MYNRAGYLSKVVVIVSCFLLPLEKINGQLSTQVGIGALYINGDVDHVLDPLNSFHIGISKTFRSNFNAELKFGFSKTGGLSGSYMESAQNGGGLIEEVYSGLGNLVWYPNYLTTYAYTDLSVNYIWQTGIKRLRLLGGVGLGFSMSNSSINMFYGEDQDIRYTLQLPVTTNLEEAKDKVNNGYDNFYETKFDEGGGLIPHLAFQLGIQFKIRRGIFFSADVRYHLSTSDYLDPIKNITANQESGNNDSVSMFTIGFIGYLLPDEKDNSPLK